MPHVTAEPETTAFNSWDAFLTVFNGLKEWVWDVYRLLDSIVLIQVGTIEFSIFDFGIAVLILEVFLIVYLRIRHS